MKFEEKFEDKGPHSFKSTKILKEDSLGTCDYCQGFTRWKDSVLNLLVCSEECCAELWKDTKQEQNKDSEMMKRELENAETWMETKSATKDIIIVVRDQLDYLKSCIESIENNTENYKLFIWDNASSEPTKKYLEELNLNGDIELMRK